MLDLTRILAGPVAGRTLAGYGADVMLVNSPQLPNIEAIADTSRGKRSAFADLREPADRRGLRGRAGASARVRRRATVRAALEALGFGSERGGARCGRASSTSRSRPTERARSLGRRDAASIRWCRPPPASTTPRASGRQAGEPRPLPMQILDMATGVPARRAASQAALLRQRSEGGSPGSVQVSLARTASVAALRSAASTDGFAAPRADFKTRRSPSDSGFGRLQARAARRALLA